MKKYFVFPALLGVALLLFSLLTPSVARQEATEKKEKKEKKERKIDEVGYANVARPFLDKYCVRCHAGTSAKGAFRTDDALSADFNDRAMKAKWGEVVNQLGSHLMPPKDQLQPPQSAVTTLLDWIADQTKQAEDTLRDKAPVMRRLTRDEYKNTIRDLVGIDFDTSGFPADPPAGGFDNNARALTVSPLHIELYANAAKQILDQALVPEGAPRPPKILWRFDPKNTAMDQRRVAFDAKNNSVIVNGGKNTEEGDWVVVHHESWDKGVDARNFSVPIEGTYIIRLRAAGRVPTRAQVVAGAERVLAGRRDQQIKENPQGTRWHNEAYQNDLKHFQTDPLYNYGPPRVKIVQHLGSQPRTVAECDITEGAKTYEFPVRFTTQSAGINFHYAYDIPRVLENFWCQSNDTFARPELLIDWFELEGPIYDAWPPTSHSNILFPSPLRQSNERGYAKEVLARFMRRAYRRPVAESEIAGKLALFDQARQGQSFVEAIKAPLTAILASPNFLYLIEPEGKLNDHAQAARLSYFLWGAPPDATLTALADAGKIHDPSVLKQQTDRLLNDPRASEFVRRFAGQWLGLNQVGANPPAADLFPGYDRHLETSIVKESESFFAEILKNDLDARNLIKSDFVVVNERLARAYGIPNVKGDTFRRVSVPAGVHRGGVATQASVLTITSNGTRTSPVKRGTWIMKTLLGADPGLPVANAGEIAARVPGIEKATVRKRLEIHRTRPQCARCHSSIDPLGFALENYDASGAWREREGFGYKGRVEPNDPLIDARSSLPDGTKIVGVEGLQDALMARSDDFLTALASKVLTFALGRELSVADRPLVKNAVTHMKKNNYTLRALIEFVTTSEEFNRK
jgi:hypothetical protein